MPEEIAKILWHCWLFLFLLTDLDTLLASGYRELLRSKNCHLLLAFHYFYLILRAIFSAIPTIQHSTST
jgi:hypothetical protein